jgi:hypothetical protein
MNTQLLAQLATTNQLVDAALDAADRRDPAQPVGPVAVKLECVIPPGAWYADLP